MPDIPLEETPEIRKVAESHGLELVLLTTPTTPQVGCLLCLLRLLCACCCAC